MSSTALPSQKADSQVPLTGEFIPPAHALREMPLDLPEDEVDRDIAVFLAEHPKLRHRFGEINLALLSHEARLQLLADIKAELGIRPIRSRTLGYVGSE